MAASGPSIGRRLGRWSLIGAALATALAYATGIAYLKINEVALVFAPDRSTTAVPADLAAGTTRLARRMPAGRAGELLIVRRPVDHDDGPWVIFLHGNAASVTSPGNLARYRQLLGLGVDVVAPEYPGFGSVEGSPSEDGSVAAARDAWEWLRASGVAPARIAIYGWSLGSGVATRLARTVDEHGLVLEGAFTGVDDRASELYPWLPIRWIASHRFASREAIAEVGSPLLLLHARDDQVIPFAHSERLLALARPPKRLVALTGGHIVPNERDRARYEGALREFFAAIFGPVPTGRTSR